MNLTSRDNTHKYYSPDRTDENKAADDLFRREQLIDFLVNVSIFISQHESRKKKNDV